MKTLFLSFFTLAILSGNLCSQTTWNICCGEVFASGSCQAGVPHSNAGVFNPANLTISVGDRIRFYTRMELLGGYNGTHDIQFTGSPANNVLLPISTNILARVTNVTTPPFASAGVFPFECVDANHCFAFADLFSGWPCNGYGVTVTAVLAIQNPELSILQNGDNTVLIWNSQITDPEIYFVEQAGEDFLFHVVDSVKTNFWKLKSPLGGMHYRIAALNSNGDLAYTNVVSSEVSPDLDAMILPNPFSKELGISLATGNSEKVQIEILDLNGAIVYSNETPVTTPGFLSTSVNTEKFASGVYSLRVTMSGQSITRKVVKLD